MCAPILTGVLPVLVVARRRAAGPRPSSPVVTRIGTTVERWKNRRQRKSSQGMWPEQNGVAWRFRFWLSPRGQHAWPEVHATA